MAGELSQFANALFGAMDTTTNVMEERGKKQAEIDLRNIKINFDLESKTFLDNLQKDNKWDTWSGKTDDFVEKIYKQMDQIDSPYYCRNRYTAQQAQFYFDEMRNNLQNTVENLVYQKQVEKDIVDYNNNKEKYAKLYVGQDYLDNVNNDALLLYQDGKINTSQYNSELQNNYIKAETDYYIKSAQSLIDGAIASGTDFETMWNESVEKLPDLNLKGADGLEIPMDNKAIKENCKSTISKQYNARLQKMQSDNDRLCEQTYTNIAMMKDPEQIVTAIERAKLNVQRMTGNKLDNGRQKYWIDAYDNLLNLLSKGSNGGSKKSDLDSWEKLAKNSPDTMVALYKQGDPNDPDAQLYNVYDIQEAMARDLTDSYMFGNYKENVGKDMSQRKQDLDTLYLNDINTDSLGDKLLQEILKTRPGLKTYFDNDFKNLREDILKHPENYTNTSVYELARYLTDIVKESDKTVTDDQILEKLNKYVKSCNLSGIEGMALKKNGKSQYKWNADDYGDVNYALKMLTDNDWVFSDSLGEHWTKGAKETIEMEGGIRDILAANIRSTLGLPSDAQIGSYYRKTDYDMDPMPIFTVGDKRYELAAGDDNVSFTVNEIDEKGNIIATYDGITPEDRRKANKNKYKPRNDDISKRNLDYSRSIMNRYTN